MILLPLLLALTGLVMAVVVNYLADVLPYTRRLTRAACANCGTPYSSRDYLLMHSCRDCGQRRSIRTFVVLVLGIPLALGAWRASVALSKLPLGLSLVLLTYLAVVLVIDLEHRAILHETSYVGAGLALVCGTYLWSAPQDKTLVQGLITSLLGGAVGFGLMYLLYLLGELFGRWLSARRGEPVDEVALGFGDVNLTGILGLILGPAGIAYAIFLAIIASGLASFVILLVSLIRRTYHAFMAIPYAPFLILGALWLLYGP
jgi:prepilin signal peptidase PulO-like enzyme (type II secretory pathway)